MSSFERPPADPDAIVAAWRAWVDEDELPGRTMADLKIAGLDLVLATVATDSEGGAVVLEGWQRWESGQANPEETLKRMQDDGIDNLILAIATAI